EGDDDSPHHAGHSAPWNARGAGSEAAGDAAPDSERAPEEGSLSLISQVNQRAFEGRNRVAKAAQVPVATPTDPTPNATRCVIVITIELCRLQTDRTCARSSFVGSVPNPSGDAVCKTRLCSDLLGVCRVTLALPAAPFSNLFRIRRAVRFLLF